MESENGIPEYTEVTVSYIDDFINVNVKLIKYLQQQTLPSYFYYNSTVDEDSTTFIYVHALFGRTKLYVSRSAPYPTNGLSFFFF